MKTDHRTIPLLAANQQPPRESCHSPKRPIQSLAMAKKFVKRSAIVTTLQPCRESCRSKKNKQENFARAKKISTRGAKVQPRCESCHSKNHLLAFRHGEEKT
jgi:hypothetical protein